MPEELKRITEGFRENAGGLTDGEADEIFRFCLRKMEVCGIENQEEYLPLLFRDEVKNFIIRSEKDGGGGQCVRYADSLRVIRDARTPENRRVNTLVSSVGMESWRMKNTWHHRTVRFAWSVWRT